MCVLTLERTDNETYLVYRRDNPFNSGVENAIPLGTRFLTSQRVVRAEHAFVSNDVLADDRLIPEYKELYRRNKEISAAIFPLTFAHEFMGIIALGARSKGYFDEEKQHLYQTLAEQGAVALRAARLRETIRESQQRLSLLIQQSPLGVIEWNTDFTVASWNPAAEKIFGYTREEALGRNKVDLIVPETFKPHVKKIWQDLVEQKGGTHSINDNVTKDRRIIICEWFNAPLVNAEGSATGVASLVEDITDRKRAEEALEKSLRDKEVLLKELQHRVKNNLNIISSLLGLEMEKLSDDRSKQVFIDAQSRIRSMSTIYDQLYSSAELDKVDLDMYLKDLGDSLFKTYAIDTGRILLATTLAKIQLDIKRAVPLGLIMNELMTNALKYAFPSGGRGEIRIDLEKSENQITLSLSDNGVGLTDGFDAYGSDSMGLRLVKMLTEQIDGTLTVKSKKGTKVSVKFKL